MPSPLGPLFTVPTSLLVSGLVPPIVIVLISVEEFRGEGLPLASFCFRTVIAARPDQAERPGISVDVRPGDRAGEQLAGLQAVRLGTERPGSGRVRTLRHGPDSQCARGRTARPTPTNDSDDIREVGVVSPLDPATFLMAT